MGSRGGVRWGLVYILWDKTCRAFVSGLCDAAELADWHRGVRVLFGLSEICMGYEWRSVDAPMIP